MIFFEKQAVFLDSSKLAAKMIIAPEVIINCANQSL